MNNKQFTIFKVKEHDGDEKKPTHNISMKIGEQYQYCGKCWTKDSNGNKFLSCSLDKEYNDKPGYSITVDPKEQSIDPETGLNCSDVPF